MLLLFLDTETSGVVPAKSQIIELGGVLAELDEASLKLKEIDTFESLVSLRADRLDAKITRITGINEEDLVDAPDIHKVQERWLEWLTPYEGKIKGIIGHSIFFDTGFLNHEKWFLPEVKEIDTLNLSRVLFPNYQAINLEYLIKKFELLDTDQKQDHRSLSDTRLSMGLFQRILNYVKNLNLEIDFLEDFKKDLLPLDLNFYLNTNDNNSTKEKPGVVTKSDTSSSELVINIFKEDVQESVFARFNYAVKNLDLSILKKVFNLNLKDDLKLSFYQIYFAIIVARNNPELFLKFHLPGKKEYYYWFLIILEALEKELSLNDNKVDSKVLKTTLKYPEDLLNQDKYLFKHNLKFGKVIHLIEFLQSILISNSDIISNQKHLIKQAQALISEYDFFILSLQPFLDNSKYAINPYSKDWKEKPIFDRFQSLNESLKNFQELVFSYEKELKDYSSLLELLLIKLADSYYGFNVNPYTFYELYLQNTDLFVSFNKKGFDLGNYFNGILNEYPNLKLESLLDEATFFKILEIAGIKKQFEDKDNLEYKFLEELDVERIDTLDLDDFYNLVFQKVKETNKPVLVLTGLNSTINDSQKALTHEYTPEDYLILGESGSVTKIISKCLNGFTGVVVVKYNNFRSFSNHLDKINFANIWVVNQPYFFLGKFWQNQAKKTSDPDLITSFLKQTQLKINLAKITESYDGEVKYLRGYSI
jgi:DNA polymerase III epsilon subunit-like protein